MTSIKQQTKETQSVNHKHLDGVAIGVLVGISDSGQPLVIYPSNPNETAIKAKATVALDVADIGKEIALLFEGGNPERPLIIGRIQNPHEDKEPQQDEENEITDIEIDGEQISLTAKQSIRLKCGKASITLTRSGKILVRGTYILNRSSGANRIKGGSVQIN